MNKQELAAELLGVDVESSDFRHKPVPDEELDYYWNNSRGGSAVIIDKDGEHLTAGSAVSFAEHLAAYKKGYRD